MTQTKNILVIDETHSDRVLLGSILGNYGCHVETCHTNTDNAADEVSFSLIVVSYDSPGLPCEEFVRKVKSRKKPPDILVTSLSPSVDAAVSVMREGALDFLVKPVATEALIHHIDRVFSREGGEPVISKTSEKPVIVSENHEVKRLMSLIDQVADSTASVLIQGESGTGKELFARYVHAKSKRRSKPFIAVNCAALPENLLESELFGHEKGAFTGAVSRKAGKFELAQGGTILLDEVTEMQPHLQAKLLRVLQEREVDLVGGVSPVRIDTRVIATTNRIIEDSVEKGEFREDLYYRLNVIPIHIPPLRERRDDIMVLTDFFIRKFNRIDGRNVKSLTKDAMGLLKSHAFKGNVRELENIIQRAVLLSDGEVVKNSDLFLKGSPSGINEKISSANQLAGDILASPLKDVERKMIMHTLEKTGGNRTHAAKILEISVRTLRNKLNEYKESGTSL